MSEFKKVKIGDKEYYALKFGLEGFEMSPRVMQNTRRDGILVKDNDILPFPWHGVTKDKDGEYILLPPVELEDITAISSKYRDKALSLVIKIARGLYSADESFLDLSTGIFPLYRIYIASGSDIVLLPPDAGEILTLSRTPSDIDRSVRNLLTPSLERGYTLVHEMAQLLYFALSGRFPYEKPEVRGAGFKPYSLNYYTSTSDETSAFIMNTLLMGEKQQRRVCLNNTSRETLKYFLDKSETLEWEYPAIEDSERIWAMKKSEGTKVFIEEKKKREKRASKRTFLRKKGVITLVIVIVASIVGYLVGNFLYQKFRAPYTKDLSPTEIISYTIEKQNELDAASLNEGYKKDAAQYKEVTTLYILNKTRLAYESKAPFISLEEWKENDEGAIEKDQFVYGVEIESITDEGDEKYTAELTWYTPYGFSDDDEEMYEEREGYTRTFVYSVTEHFTFEYNKRGWWECTDSYFSDDKLLDVIYIPNVTTEAL